MFQKYQLVNRKKTMFELFLTLGERERCPVTNLHLIMIFTQPQLLFSYIINFNDHILSYILQTIVFLFHILQDIANLIHFLCHNPFHSFFTIVYKMQIYILGTPISHCHSTSLSLSPFSQSPLWKLTI